MADLRYPWLTAALLPIVRADHMPSWSCMVLLQSVRCILSKHEFAKRNGMPYHHFHILQLLARKTSNLVLSNQSNIPLISHMINLSFVFRKSSKLSPILAAAPGTRFCTNTSALFMSSLSTWRSGDCLMSRVNDSLFRLVHTKWLQSSPCTLLSWYRTKSPVPGRSILMTRAPRSANCLVQYGPLITCSRATTSMPSNGRFWGWLKVQSAPIVGGVSGRGFAITLELWNSFLRVEFRANVLSRRCCTLSDDSLKLCANIFTHLPFGPGSLNDQEFVV